jgi:hypothetical protein
MRPPEHDRSNRKGDEMPITLRQINDKNLEDEYKDLSAESIAMANITGFAAEDIETIRLLCADNFLMLVIRCPKRGSRFSIGKLPPKPKLPERFKDVKSNPDTGIGETTYRWVSDYDLMSIWEANRGEGAGRYSKVPGYKSAHGTWDPRFIQVMRIFNRQLTHKFQHGTNDDYVDYTPGGPKIKNGADKLVGGHYVAFTETGFVRYLPTFGHLQKFYRDNGLAWPY